MEALAKQIWKLGNISHFVFQDGELIETWRFVIWRVLVEMDVGFKSVYTVGNFRQ